MSSSLAPDPVVGAAVGLADARSLGPRDQDFLGEIARLAEEYPHPHSIFGGREAGPYVRDLANRERFPGEGWYGAGTIDSLGAVHLGVYGVGKSRGHSLFKLRHPLLEGPDGVRCLADAFETAGRAAARVLPGTQKLVVFLGESEAGAREAAEQAGFVVEGVVSDYYRLGERCFILGRTELE